MPRGNGIYLSTDHNVGLVPGEVVEVDPMLTGIRGGYFPPHGAEQGSGLLFFRMQICILNFEFDIAN